MKHGSGPVAEGGARLPSDGRAAVLRGASILILAWSSIWIFLFQHASPRWQEATLLFPVMSILALVAFAVAGHRTRPGPWVWWFGALLVHATLGSALNPSVFASAGRAYDFLLSVALGLPILLVLGRAALGARILCGLCIVLSLAGLLDNVGFDVRAGVVGVVLPDPVSEEVLAETADPSLHKRSQRATSVWALFLAWTALAALRPATRRDWLVAASVFVPVALVVASGYSWATKLTFIAGIGVFFVALYAPRFVLRTSLVVLLVVFLGAPLGAKTGWLWFTGHSEAVSRHSDIGGFRGLRTSIVQRLAQREFWAELIERRPWTGFGLYANQELPHMSLPEVFGARPSYAEASRHFVSLRSKSTHTVFPHSFPLQMWGELGTFGILLVTGFVASLLVNAAPTRPRDAGAAARVTLLVTVLLVFGVDRSVWTPQNVVQLALTAGLAAGTLTTHERSVPAVALPGLSLRGERFLILFVLLIGLLVAVGNSVRSSLADRRYAPEHTTLDLERGLLRHRAEEIALDGLVVGYIDWLDFIDGGTRSGRGAIAISGWAYDSTATGEALQVLLFRGSELFGVTRTGRTRPDVQRTSGLPNLDLLFTGYELRVPRPLGWHPQTKVNAVFLSPSGSASIARVTDPARQRMNALPVGASGFYVYVDENENALIYVRDECGEDNIGPKFFLHVVPVDRDDLPDSRGGYHFDNLDFFFDKHGSMKDGRCYAMRDLPDYDIAEISTGQFIPDRGQIWEERLTFGE